MSLLASGARDGDKQAYSIGGSAVAEFKIVTPKGTSFAVAGGGYEFEQEALESLGLRIEEIDASSENSFIDAAHDADAVYAKGRTFTKRMIDGLERCKLIALGTVGSDYVDVAAATANAWICVDAKSGIAAGSYYVMMREQDIAARRFDDARMIYQCD